MLVYLLDSLIRAIAIRILLMRKMKIKRMTPRRIAAIMPAEGIIKYNAEVIIKYNAGVIIIIKIQCKTSLDRVMLLNIHKTNNRLVIRLQTVALE